jgi:hypothetical protein
MKPTSPSSKTRRRSRVEQSIKVSCLSGEDRVLAFLKEVGARPMTAKEKRDLAAIGCLGMPEE